MTMQRILVAVDDTAGALHAARVAVALASQLDAQLRFVHVLGDGELSRHFAGIRRNGTLRVRRTSAATSLLAHVDTMARGEGVAAEAVALEGDRAAVILAEGATWHADLLVLGRSREFRAGHSDVGATARHVLEFSEVPVLVVP